MQQHQPRVWICLLWCCIFGVYLLPNVVTAQCDVTGYTNDFNAYSNCIAANPIEFCNCQTQFSEYYAEALGCSDVLPANTLESLQATDDVYASCGNNDNDACDLGQFYDDSEALRTCVAENIFDGTQALCDCADEFSEYLRVGEECFNLLPDGAREALNATDDQFQESCASSDTPHGCSLTEYGDLQAEYSQCVTDSANVCDCRTQFDRALEMALLCSPQLPDGAVTSMRQAAAFIHTTCDSEAGVTLQFNPASYTVTTATSVSVAVTRRGSAAGVVTARLSVLFQGVYTGQFHDIEFDDGVVDPVSVVIDLSGLGPTGVQASTVLQVAIGSVSGERAAAGTPDVATITIAPSGIATESIVVVLPSTGVQWAATSDARPLKVATEGLVGKAGVTLQPWLQHMHANGSVAEAWPLRVAPGSQLDAGGGVAMVLLPDSALPGGAHPAPTSRHANYTVRVVEQVNTTAADGSHTITTGVSGTSTRFSLVSPGAVDAPALPSLNWASTAGTNVIVAGESVTLTWPGATASPTAELKLTLIAECSAEASSHCTALAHRGAVAVVGQANMTMTSSLVWTAEGMSSVVIGAGGEDASVNGRAGWQFRFRGVVVDATGVAETMSTPFTLAPKYGYMWNDWSGCSEQCGLGNHSRTVECVNTVSYHTAGGASATQVSMALCHEPVPDTTRACVIKPCSPTLAAYTLGAWSACSLPCGGGAQVRELGCVDATGDAVPVASCELAGVSPPQHSVRECNAAPCEEFTWSAGEWGACSAACAPGGVRVREVKCVGAHGSVSAGGLACAGGSAGVKPVAWESCNTDQCGAATWQASAWGDCTVSCGGGTTSRTVQCVDPSTGSPLPNSACSDAGTKPDTSRSCNPQPCPASAYRWLAGHWSPCSAACGATAQRTRTVECVAVTTGAVAPSTASCAGQAQPPLSAPCGDVECDACAALNGTCAAPLGSCVDGVCLCSSGYFGAFCRSTSTRCPDGRLDADGECCASKVLTLNGTCCGGTSAHPPTLDSSGQCCPTQVDECGVCGGSGRLDMGGTCCTNGVLGADGRCCVSGMLDMCGVCDGTGRTCKLYVDVTVSVNRAPSSFLPRGSFAWLRYETIEFAASMAPVLNVQQDRIVDVSIVAIVEASRRRLTPGSATSHINVDFVVTPPLSAQDAAVETIAASLLSDTSGFIHSVQSFTAAGSCGNGLCEVGEQCVERSIGDCCDADCPAVVHSCPVPHGGVLVCSGHGTCVAASGDCECDWGYSGVDCSRCAEGYAKTASGSCEAVFVSSFQQGTTTTGGGDTTTTTTTTGDGTTTTGGSTSGDGTTTTTGGTGSGTGGTTTATTTTGGTGTTGGSTSTTTGGALTTTGGTTTGGGNNGDDGSSSIVLYVVVVVAAVVVLGLLAVYKPWQRCSGDASPQFSSLHSQRELGGDKDGVGMVRLDSVDAHGNPLSKPAHDAHIPASAMAPVVVGGYVAKGAGGATGYDKMSVSSHGTPRAWDEDSQASIVDAGGALIGGKPQAASRWLETVDEHGVAVMKDSVTGATLPIA